MPFERSLIRAKSHPPPIPADWVTRPRLHERLDVYRERPLTLVTAGAGYGKSTLVSAWIRSVDCAAAWLTLDEGDADLREFLQNLLLAINRVLPTALHETRGLIEPAHLPPVSQILGMLVNDLDDLDEPLILVLDDVHYVREGPVRDFLSGIFSLPQPREFYLVLVGREMPDLPVARLRARGLLNELSARDLQFTAEETEVFLRSLFGATVTPEMARSWADGAEGWPTGLRLAALGTHGAPSADPFKAWRSRGQARQFLLQEVLQEQPPGIVDALLATSVARRFNAELCETLQGEPLRFPGREFIAELDRRNLFLIPLDGDGEWYRYHDLFRELLREELLERRGRDALRSLCRTAIRWFETAGLVDDAIVHALDET